MSGEILYIPDDEGIDFDRCGQTAPTNYWESWNSADPVDNDDEPPEDVAEDPVHVNVEDVREIREFLSSHRQSQ